MKKSRKNKILFLLKNQNGCAINHFTNFFLQNQYFYFEILTKFFRNFFLVEALIFSKTLDFFSIKEKLCLSHFNASVKSQIYGFSFSFLNFQFYAILMENNHLIEFHLTFSIDQKFLIIWAFDRILFWRLIESFKKIY